MTNQDTTSIDVSQNDNSDTPKQSCITNDTSIDEQIREMLFNWHKWRDYYYSDLQEQVITDDEWKVTRDKIDYDAIEKIKALISDQVAKARIEGAVMGAKFGNAAFRQYNISNPGKPINLDTTLYMGIEQASEWAKRK